MKTSADTWMVGSQVWFTSVFAFLCGWTHKRQRESLCAFPPHKTCATFHSIWICWVHLWIHATSCKATLAKKPVLVDPLSVCFQCFLFRVHGEYTAIVSSEIYTCGMQIFSLSLCVSFSSHDQIFHSIRSHLSVVYTCETFSTFFFFLFFRSFPQASGWITSLNFFRHSAF